MSLTRRITNLFSRSTLKSEIDAELQSHIDMRIEDNLAAGMSPHEARRDALVRFGNPSAIKEQVVHADAALGLESFWADVRYALRQLHRSPGFTWPSILILALGIGACTAIFSAVKPILLDPLPYPHASSLMMLWEEFRDSPPSDVTFGTFYGVEQRNHSFDTVAVMKPWQPTIVSTERPERFEGQRVSANFFRTLGIAPLIGRDFNRDDDRFRGPNVVILSDSIWRRRFSADTSIIGHQVRLDDTLYTVIGVMPRSFDDVLAPATQLWAPLQYDPSLPYNGREWGHHLRMIGRLRSGVTREQAVSELTAILHVLTPIYAKGYDSSGGAPNGIFVNPLQADLTQSVRPALLAVIGAAFLVLLIACVNVTNLLLARGTQRLPEFAMRAALGAARSRLIRQLLTESLVLSMLGGIFGIFIAIVGVHALIALSPPGLPRVSAIGVDATVFLFAFAITTFIGIIVGLVPALHASRGDLNTGLRQTSQRTIGGHPWTRRVLVIAELSLAGVLLISAGLLFRSMQRLLSVDPGFDASHLLTMQVQESGRRFDADAVRLEFFTQALDKVCQMPGVTSAGFTAQLPLSGDLDAYGVETEHEDKPGGITAFRYAVTPGYIETMHIPLRRGRLLNGHDTTGAPAAVLINETLAKLKFPHQDPIGQHMHLGLDVGHPDHPWATIVGVVGDVKQQSLSINDEPAFYISTAQWPWVDDAQTLVVRTSGDPAALTSIIRNAIWSVDKDQPIVRVATMESIVTTSEAQRHFVLMLFAAFALVGLLLAATGIYAVLSGSVSERTREIGVRSALGATRGNILGLILGQGMTLTLLGVLIGLGGAVLATRAIASLLFGVSQFDIVTYAAVTLTLLGISALACIIPARRAASVNPVEALRAE